MIHHKASPFAGKKVKINGKDFRVEDWWDRIYGNAWRFAALKDGNFAAVNYGVRVAKANLPQDDEVLYGKDMDGLGHLVHLSEVGRDVAKTI